MACSRLREGLELELALERLSVKKPLPDAGSHQAPVSAGVGSLCLLQTAALEHLWERNVLWVLPSFLTSPLESKLTAPPDYVHRVINEPGITILAELLLHPI